MINFTRAFDTAWERTAIILFRPFDSWKWFILGFNAFLVVLAEGGVSFNSPPTFSKQEPPKFYHSLPPLLHDTKEWLLSLQSSMAGVWMMIYLILGILAVVLWLALTWVGCRGEFMFIDNIVRNRAALVAPWRRYVNEGNAWFLFYLVLTLVSVVLAIISLVIFFALSWAWIVAERSPQGFEIGMLTLYLLVFLGIWLLYCSFIYILRSLMIPLMFKQTLGAWAAFRAVMRLVVTHPASIALYVLISFAIGVAGGMLTILIACITCCCLLVPALVPFIGTLLVSALLTQLVLPILIYIRCFSLDCLAQFGPEYDVWIVDVPSAGAASLPPPRG